MRRSFEYVGDNSTFQKRITAILVIQWVTLCKFRLFSLLWSILSLSTLRLLSFSAKYLSLIFLLPAHRLLRVRLSIQSLSRLEAARQINILTFIKFRSRKNFTCTATIRTWRHGHNRHFSSVDSSVAISSATFQKELEEGKHFLKQVKLIVGIDSTHSINFVLCLGS
jgi:hypothetical protein